MCSRFQLKTPGSEIAAFFGIEDFPDWVPREEIRPTDTAPVIVAPGVAALAGFGLPAPWNKDKPLLNARAETLTEKPTFAALLNRRCLIPASGYFEWRSTPTGKRKNLITLEEAPLMVFAGLTDGNRFTIVTCAPTTEIAHIHDRMPVILTAEGQRRWIERDHPFSEAKQGLTPWNGPKLTTQEETPEPPAQGDLFL